MNIGALTTDTPEKKPPTTLRANQVRIQWRCLDTKGKWHNHYPVERSAAAELVKNYNVSSTVFEYRIQPDKKAVDTTGAAVKVAA